MTACGWDERCPACGCVARGVTETGALRTLAAHFAASHATSAPEPAGPQIGSPIHIAHRAGYPYAGDQATRCIAGIITEVYGTVCAPGAEWTWPTEDQRIIAVAFTGDPPATVTCQGIPYAEGTPPAEGTRRNRMCGGRLYEAGTWHWPGDAR